MPTKTLATKTVAKKPKPAAAAPTVESIVAELKQFGSEAIKRVFAKHGAPEPFYGVKVEDLKKIQKRVKVNHPLALELYATGISDAMYLAGLIADPAAMTKKDLDRWAAGATWHMHAGFTVAGVAAEGPHAREIGLKWIESKKELIATAGWSTLAGYVSITDDAALDLKELRQLLSRVERSIHEAPDRVRYTMNGFVIALGCAVPALTEAALAAAARIGKVEVDMGDTSCKVPSAAEYIEKVRARGTLGKKRMHVRC